MRGRWRRVRAAGEGGARTVDATLDRVSTAVGAHRRVVADAAHELRSPMAVLRTRLDLPSPTVARVVAGEQVSLTRL